MNDKQKFTATRDLYRYWQKITARWRDNDIYGHINNTVYYSYIDSIINGYMIERGVLDPNDGIVIGLVVESHCQFYEPLSYPVLVDGGLRVEKIGTTSVGYEVGMFSEGKDYPSAVGGYTHVFVDRSTNRPMTIPPTLRKALESLTNP